jgi:hypothetical protein
MMLAYVRQFYGHLLSSVGDGEIAYEYEAGHCRPLMVLRLWNYQILHVCPAWWKYCNADRRKQCCGLFIIITDSVSNWNIRTTLGSTYHTVFCGRWALHIFSLHQHILQIYQDDRMRVMCVYCFYVYWNLEVYGGCAKSLECAWIF